MERRLSIDDWLFSRIDSDAPMMIQRYKGWNHWDMDPKCYQCEHPMSEHVMHGFKIGPHSNTIVDRCRFSCGCRYYSPSYIGPPLDDALDD